MSEVIQAKCPGCQKVLRLPNDNRLDQKLKCKFCGMILEARKKPVLVAKPEMVASPPASTIPQHPVQPTAPVIVAPPHHGPVIIAPPTQTPMAPPAPVGYQPPVYSQPVSPPAPQAPQIISQPYPYDQTPTSEPPYTDQSRYSPAFSSSTEGYAGKGKKYRGPGKGGSKSKWIVLGLLFVAILGGGGASAWFLKPEWFGQPPVEVTDNNDNKEGPNNDKLNTSSTLTDMKGVSNKFPRRMLGINVTNYVYANAIENGTIRPATEQKRRDTHAAMTILAQRWSVPPEQFFELSDGLLHKDDGDRVRPPLKSLIEKTIDLFLESSREQDRIIILFCGHAIEIDGEGYLVPLEGDLEESKTLIPLKDIYAKIDKCKAQEKLLIFDICRYDPGRGQERLAGGKMSEGLEKALHAAPTSTHVWTSCSMDEYSYEYEVSSVDNKVIYGSVFLSMLFAATNDGKNFGGIQKPENPFSIDALGTWMQKTVSQVSGDLGGKQTPKLTKSGSLKSVAYDSKEAPAKAFDLPPMPPMADQKEVQAVLKEIEVPTIKVARKDAPRVALDRVIPFDKDALKGYEHDGKMTPLREATLAALKQLREFRQIKTDGGPDLPERFSGSGAGASISEAAKKQILEVQRVPAEKELEFKELLEKLEEAKAEDEKLPEDQREKSKRWLANYDWAHAQIKSRLTYLKIYNLMLGKVRKDELPTLDAKLNHRGWKLASVDIDEVKPKPAKEIRDLATEAKESLNKIIEEHPNTPWALLAKRERSTALGLQWQASSFENP